MSVAGGFVLACCLVLDVSWLAWVSIGILMGGARRGNRVSFNDAFTLAGVNLSLDLSCCSDGVVVTAVVVAIASGTGEGFYQQLPDTHSA